MQAKFRTRCPLCSNTIEAGAEIAKREGKWAHAICPQTTNRTGARTSPAQTTAQPMPAAWIAARGSAQAPASGPQAPAIAFYDPAAPVSEAIAPAPVTATPKRTPSPQQQAIIDAVRDTTDNLMIEAGAGTGKTTTCVMTLDVIDPSARTIFVTFNKHNEKDIASRAPEHVRVKTTHGEAYSTLRRIYKSQVDERKGEKILDGYPVFRIPEQADQEERAEKRQLRQNMLRACAMCKNTLTAADDPDAVRAMFARYNIDANGDEDTIITMLPTVLDKMRADTARVDFDDMLWLPVVLNLAVTQYDIVYVDEAQDLNRCQLELVRKMVAPGGRLIAVGDVNQSLYAFRGAATDAMPSIAEAFHCRSLPLTVTRRCAKAIVAHVNASHPYITYEAHDTNAAGAVLTVKEDRFDPAEGDMVLCRTNAPLIGPAFQLIRAGKKAVVRGRDIGANLATLADKLAADCAEIREVYDALAKYQRKETEKLERRRASETQLAALEDKCATLAVIMDGCDTPADIRPRIESIFSDDAVGTVFSTIHKAKGLEAQRVWILRPDLLPMRRKNTTPEEMVQERNAEYVAYTRAIETLVIVLPPKAE